MGGGTGTGGSESWKPEYVREDQPYPGWQPEYKRTEAPTVADNIAGVTIEYVDFNAHKDEPVEGEVVDDKEKS